MKDLGDLRSAMKGSTKKQRSQHFLAEIKLLLKCSVRIL